MDIPAPKATIGRYLLKAKLGEGGMGEVYRAQDPRLGRTIAIKLLPARFASVPDKLERFDREARAASALNHPNIITVYDAGVDSETPWIAMELIEGRALRPIIRDKQLNVENALGIALQIAEALAKAHEANIVHRDLKPENVMVAPDGLVKVLDFGLAKLVDYPAAALQSNEETQLITADGKVLGTPSYMSPEQVRGWQVDHRSDQFAFGILLYEMIAGANPFRRETAAQTMSAIIESDPQPLQHFNATIPGRLSYIVSRCLAKDPAQRYDRTLDLVAELKAARESSGNENRLQARLSRRIVLSAGAAILGACQAL
jgi:serine/threonine protein kinase